MSFMNGVVFLISILYFLYWAMLIVCREEAILYLLFYFVFYLYYSTVYFSIVLFYCYATWHNNFLRD